MTEPIKTKTCRVCKQTKSFSEFPKNPQGRNGLRNDCRICRNKQNTEYHQTKQGKATRKRYIQSEYGKAAAKRYRQTENYKIKQNRYRQSEKGKAAIKRYTKSEKGKVISRFCQKRFCIRHPERRKAKATVMIAIRDGKLPRPDSLQCHYGKHPAQQYHHPSYAPEHWLNVLPTCIICHKKIHKRIA